MIAFLIIATLAGFQAQDEPGTARHLIQHLYSDDIEAREEALRGLKALGESARAALEEAGRSSTKSVADSARFLIRRLDVIKRLTGRFVKARTDAIDQLASEDPHAWTEVLLESTKWTSEGHRFPSLRRSDVEALIEPAFRGAQSTKERKELCLLVQNWRLRTAVPELARYLEHADIEVQESAASALAVVDAVELVESIASIRFQGPNFARFQVSRALVSLGAIEQFPKIKTLQTWSTSHSSPVVDAIGGLGLREELPFVVRHLDRGTATYSVLNTLGILQAREQADRVAKFLKDPADEVRSLAAEALGRMGAREHADAVAVLLEDKGVNNCASRAVAALETIGSPSHLPQVIPLLKHSFPHVRARAIRVIKILGGNERIPDLAALLKDPDKETRIGAAVALIELNATEQLPAIRALIVDESDGRNLSGNYSNLLRTGAALMRLRDREPLVEAYRRHGLSEHSWVRHAALTALTEAGELDAAGQSALLADLLDTPAGESYSVYGLSLVNALMRIHEPKTWTRLNLDVELTRGVEKSEDFKTWLQELGLKVSVEGNLVFQGRMDKGQRTSPALFIEKHAWRPRALYSEGDSLTILRWDAALERWAKRLSRRP